MSDMEKNQSAACDGDCTSCGSSCGFGESDATVTLTLDDDTTIECAVLTIYPVGGREYIALLPLDENGENQDGEVYLYRYSETEDGTPNLDNIEDDDEYEIVAEAFDELLDAQEYDELVGEVEEE